MKHNDDPAGQGRVRVQFQWQEGSQLTDWIAVMSPDAGGIGEKVAKNRGFVFIPEVGDLVMVGFRNQNADAPFVMGSLHHGDIASGGGKGNRTKSLTTRSGSTLTLDAQGFDWYQNHVLEYSRDRLLIICSNQPQEYTFCHHLIDLRAG